MELFSSTSSNLNLKHVPYVPHCLHFIFGVYEEVVFCGWLKGVMQ